MEIKYDRTKCTFCNRTVRKISFGRGKVFIGYSQTEYIDKENKNPVITINKCDDCIAKDEYYIVGIDEDNIIVRSVYFNKR